MGNGLHPTIAALILAIAVTTFSSPIAASPPSVARPTNRLPSASEVFNLRSKCAKLGEKLLADDIHGSAVYVEVLSSYNPATNRCHVTLTAQPADLSLPQRYTNVTLYDGQTGEMLAVYKIDKDGTKSGLGFKNGELGFENTKKYVDDMMREE